MRGRAKFCPGFDSAKGMNTRTGFPPTSARPRVRLSHLGTQFFKPFWAQGFPFGTLQVRAVRLNSVQYRTCPPKFLVAKRRPPNLSKVNHWFRSKTLAIRFCTCTSTQVALALPRTATLNQTESGMKQLSSCLAVFQMDISVPVTEHQITDPQNGVPTCPN